MNYKVSFDQIDWQSPIPGMRSKIEKHGDRRLRLVEYTKEMAPHWCEKGHVGYILEGEFEIEFPSGTHTYRKGDGVFIPSGYEHRHMGRVLSDRVLVVFVEDV